MEEHKCEGCKHEDLRYCPHCDKVYCLECGRVWGENYWTYNPVYGTTTSWPECNITFHG